MIKTNQILLTCHRSSYKASHGSQTEYACRNKRPEKRDRHIRLLVAGTQE